MLAATCAWESSGLNITLYFPAMTGRTSCPVLILISAVSEIRPGVVTILDRGCWVRRLLLKLDCGGGAATLMILSSFEYLEK